MDAERNLTVVFGPSPSRFFPKAVAYARAVAKEVAEPDPDGTGPPSRSVPIPIPTLTPPLSSSGSAIGRARRSNLGPIPVSPVIAKDMEWCAGDQVRRHGTCRYRYFMGVPRRCPACPLYEPERAEREMRGEGGASADRP